MKYFNIYQNEHLLLSNEIGKDVTEKEIIETVESLYETLHKTEDKISMSDHKYQFFVTKLSNGPIIVKIEEK